MSTIIGSLPVALQNGTLADATQVMSDFNFIVSQVNANAAQLAGGNAFTGAQSIAGDTIATLTALQTLTQKTLTAPTITAPVITGAGTAALASVATTNDNGGLSAKLSTSAGAAGLTVLNESGARKIELLFAGSTSPSFYGITAGNSVVNFATGNFTMSFGDVAAHFFKSNGQVVLGGVGAAGKLLVNPGNVSALGALASSGLNIDNFSGVGNLSQIGFGYTAAGANTNATAYIALVETSAIGNGFGDLVFGTRSVTSDTAPTERMRIDSTGNITAQGVDISRSKSATTSRNTTTTMADDPHLSMSLGVGTWQIDMTASVWATTGGAGGFKGQFHFTGTQTSAFFSDIGTQASTFITRVATDGLDSGLNPQMNSLVVGTGVTAADWFKCWGTIVVTVAGTFSFQWAQNSSSANAANLGVGSSLSCKKVA